jgi:pSer/pThr/pTyr-binding forkhead associated (FHA) protein
MPKLVLLSAGLTGRTHELKVDKTTVGRVEDNTFQIAEPSVSSHHCEILLQGGEVLIRDLNSTNGTFINGDKVSEKVLKPGQILRLGQIEMRLENGEGSSAPASAPAAPAAPAPAPAKKHAEQTLVMPRGVSLNELEQGAHGSGFDTKGTGFAKKTNKVNKMFWIIGGVLGMVIVVLLLVAYFVIKQ